LRIYAPTGGAVLDTESSVTGAEVEITAAANGNYLWSAATSLRGFRVTARSWCCTTRSNAVTV
jgi:hypothetical protein